VIRSNAIAALVGVLLASSASAQEAAKSTTTGSSDVDKLEASADQIARMKTALKQVLARVDDARNEKDVVKMNCLNEKLTQVKALLRVAEQADVALHEAVANRDAGSEAEFAKIAISRSKVDTLRAESEQCIGQLAYMVDEQTSVEVEQPSNLPGTEALSLGRATRTQDPSEVGSTMTGTDTIGTEGGASPGFGPAQMPAFVPPPVGRPEPASPSGL
jgi:hypothetical protein